MEFVTQIPDKMVINEEQHVGDDQHRRDEAHEQPNEDQSGDAEADGENNEDESIARRRETRNTKTPARYATCVTNGDIGSVAYALAVGENIGTDGPRSYKEAVASKEGSSWLMAMNEEMQSLEKNETWDLVPLPKGVKPVGCKWVFKKKEGIPGVEPARFKARLVAKGFSQKEGIDYHEVFSPVVKHKSIWVLLAMVSAFNLELEQLDVKTAFLHGSLEEKIYMSQPEGFLGSNKDHVCLLKKSLYGLKQSPRQWYKRFDSFMTSHGYIRN